MKLSHFACALALTAGAASMSFGQVTGKVILKGKIPDMPEITAIKSMPDCAKSHPNPVYEEKVVAGDKGELANVVVYVKTVDGKPAGKPSSEPVVLDQKGCMYTPHVVAVAVGQPLLVKNSDAFLHNVHTLSIDNDAMNFGQPTIGEKKLKPFTAAEAFKVKCDVHPWMVAWIVVVDTPYFGVSSADDKTIGQYSVDTKDLADGEYTFVAWHEFYGSQEAKAKVAGGKATLDFTFSTDKRSSAVPAGIIHLADAGNASSCCKKAVTK